MIEDEPQTAVDAHRQPRVRGVSRHRGGVRRGGAARPSTRQAFALLLLDVMLPGMSGFEVCQSLRARGTRVPIIVLTARTHERDRVQGLDLGRRRLREQAVQRARAAGAGARAGAARRLARARNGEDFSFGDVVVKPQQRLVTAQGPARRAVGARVRAAALPVRASQRSGRAASSCCAMSGATASCP